MACCATSSSSSSATGSVAHCLEPCHFISWPSHTKQFVQPKAADLDCHTGPWSPSCGLPVQPARGGLTAVLQPLEHHQCANPVNRMAGCSWRIPDTESTRF